VNSKALVDELTVANYPKSRICLVPNCVEISAFEKPKDFAVSDLSPLGIHAHHRVVGIVGNLRRDKNHLMFVEAMSSVLPKFPDVQGLIVGQPIAIERELPDLIESTIRKAGLGGKIILAGFRNDVPALMHRLSVFCLASNCEGMPNVLLEAMAAACPVVVTQVQGAKELISNGVNGLLVNPGDVRGFADAVETLLKNPDLAEKLGKAGRKTIENRPGCEQMALQLTNLYIRELNRRQLWSH